jgi:hypothetical protein
MKYRIIKETYKDSYGNETVQYTPQRKLKFFPKYESRLDSWVCFEYNDSKMGTRVVSFDNKEAAEEFIKRVSNRVELVKKEIVVQTQDDERL